MASPKRKTLLIIAGEESGDLYGALLAGALREAAPEYGLFGMGGDRMQRAGVEILHHIRDTAVTGLVEVASRLRELWGVYRSLVSRAGENRPAAAVLIDFPDFNLRLARKLDRIGIPVIYFISPSIWAWRPGRLRTIASCVRKMLVILPFEEPLYRSAGVDVEYCGHPLLDLVKADLSREEFQKKYGLESGSETVGLCPGSRPNQDPAHPARAARCGCGAQAEPEFECRFAAGPISRSRLRPGEDSQQGGGGSAD